MHRLGAVRIAAALALLVQFWALYAPKAPGIQTGLPLDKVVHFGLFALVTWLVIRAGVQPKWVISLMVVQAAASELTQHFFLAQRGGDWWDFAADLAGIAVGAWLARGRSGVLTAQPPETIAH